MRHPRSSQKVVVGVVYVAALFMAIMDTTIVNVALPKIGKDFDVHTASVASIAIAFFVSTAVFIPASGWLGDRFGGRRVLLGAVAVFTLASAMCGLASNLGELVGFRVLQGVGGGLMTPVGMAMLFRVFPPAERVRASSILMVPTAFAPALGPVLGGLFVTDLSWRWVFFVNVPVGVVALAIGLIFLDDHKEHDAGRFDLAGFLLAAAGFGLAMWGVSEGPVEGWSHVPVIAAALAGVVLLAVLVPVELRRSEPLLDLGVYSDRLFRSTSAVIVLAVVAFLGTLYLVALFYQDGLGLSALQSGLSTFPEAVGVLVGSQIITRRLYPVVGPRRIMLGGLLMVAATLASLTLIGATTSLWWARILMLFMGLGMSGVFIPAQAASFTTITPARTGRASTLFNAARYAGGAVGVAVLTTVVAAVGPTRLSGSRILPNLAAYHWAFLCAAAIALAAMLTAMKVSDEDAAPTMVLRARAGDRAADSSVAEVPEALVATD